VVYGEYIHHVGWVGDGMVTGRIRELGADMVRLIWPLPCRLPVDFIGGRIISLEKSGKTH
jgi:hypothetical protein